MQRIWESYYADCHAIVFMVDSTDKDRIEDVKEVFGKSLVFCIIMNKELIIPPFVTSFDIWLLLFRQDCIEWRSGRCSRVDASE